MRSCCCRRLSHCLYELSYQPDRPEESRCNTNLGSLLWLLQQELQSANTRDIWTAMMSNRWAATDRVLAVMVGTDNRAQQRRAAGEKGTNRQSQAGRSQVGCVSGGEARLAFPMTRILYDGLRRRFQGSTDIQKWVYETCWATKDTDIPCLLWGKPPI